MNYKYLDIIKLQKNLITSCVSITEQTNVKNLMYGENVLQKIKIWYSQGIHYF